ncbi:uncharacterized protein LOC132168078 [Corylus avellana]|uniref:uncharacterized protein LOC132168078 n=1 Tax=Corylus avellana TaxID=13451 RepID=UPI00286A5EBF|nr:uncharacterized protein LOC132168078 [Corylus avellana]
MGDPPRSHTSPDLYSVVGISKDICKAYKSLFMKWLPDKSPTKKFHHDAKSVGADEEFTVIHGKKDEDIDDSLYFTRCASFTSRSASRSKTPSPHSRPHSASRRSTTPLSKLMGRRSNSETEIPFTGSFLSRNGSRRSKTLTPTPASPRSWTNGSSGQSTTTLSSLMSRRSNSETEISFPFLPPEIKTPIFSSHTEAEGSQSRSARSRRSSSETEASLLKDVGRRSTTPIIFSQSTARRKPPAVEKKLKCTLEELSEGCVKKIMITRDVITNNGIIIQEEEIVKIKVKPGWREGTKVTFEGKGDEKPGYLPADIIFSIDEKTHPLFRRKGDDLEIGIEIPLVKALTGCSVPVPLLGGEKMTLSFDDIIYPGFRKLMRGCSV